MRCRIPFTYVTASILKGHRKIEPHAFGAWTVVDVPEISSSEAPVALSWTVAVPGGGIARNETRWFEEANWSLASPDKGNRERERFLAADFDRLPELEPNYFRGMRMSGGLSRSHVIADITGQDRSALFYLVTDGPTWFPDIDTVDIRELAWSGRDEAEERVREACRSLLFVDGELWVRGPEPFFSVYHPRHGWAELSDVPVIVPEKSWPAYCVTSFGSGLVPASRHCNRFRADRFDDAVDFARSICPEGQEPRINGGIDITIPHAVQFDDEGDCIRRAAQEAVDLGSEFLRHQERRSVEAWLDLRDVTAAGPEPSEIAEALRRFSETVHEDNEAAVTAKCALERWDLRPVSSHHFGL